jgi:hypothetical protein
MPHLRLSLRTLARNAIVHMAFAFLLMGSWAVFANRTHALTMALQAGVVQGALSSAITFSLKKAIDFLSARMSGLASLLAPPVIACSVSLCVLVAAHVIAGTPEVAATIAVPFSVAFSYALLYSLARWRMGGRAP